MNDQMKESFPGAKEGDTCYAVYRDLDKNGLPEGVVTWEGYNPVNKRWYLNYDRAIPWVGEKYVRMQIAAGITARKQAEKQKDFLLKEINHRRKDRIFGGYENRRRQQLLSPYHL